MPRLTTSGRLQVKNYEKKKKMHINRSVIVSIDSTTVVCSTVLAPKETVKCVDILTTKVIQYEIFARIEMD